MVDITRGSKAESFTRVTYGFLSNDGGKVYYGGDDDASIWGDAPTLCPTGTNNLLTDGDVKVDSTNNGHIITETVFTAKDGMQYKFDNDGTVTKYNPTDQTSTIITDSFVSKGDAKLGPFDFSNQIYKIDDQTTIYKDPADELGQPTSYVIDTSEYAIGIENEDDESIGDEQQVEVTAKGVNNNNIDPTGLLAQMIKDNGYNNPEVLNEFDLG